MAPEAFFLPVADGQRFCLYHPPAGRPRSALLYLHPFAEEMNKARRMAALAARQLAERGCAVLQVDLHGCGDSSGDFGDATWQGWLQDVCDARAWLGERCEAPLRLWGLRAGCLLAAEAAIRLDEPVGFLFWQPVVSGRQFLQQFLRLKLAGEMLGGEAKGVTAALKRQLAGGQPVEIAGYTLSAGLTHGLEAAELRPPARASDVLWLEVSMRDEAALPPASEKCIGQWRSAGCRVTAEIAPGPAFWQTAEIEEAPALSQATLAALAAATK